MNYKQLLKKLEDIGEYLQSKALSAVNRALTLRNWSFGLFIVEYEQNGEDRAKYGGHLIENLSASLANKGLKGVSSTNLKLFRQFYLLYPGIGLTVSDQSDMMLGRLINEHGMK